MFVRAGVSWRRVHQRGNGECGGGEVVCVCGGAVEKGCWKGGGLHTSHAALLGYCANAVGGGPVGDRCHMRATKR